MRSDNVVAIIGVGLIGGSIGLALRRGRADRRLIGIGRREESLAAARARGAVTETTTDLARGVAEADWIVVCTPVGKIVEHVRRAAEHCPPEAIITDAGSTKARIVAALNELPAGDSPRARPAFIGSHPLAGSEQTGPAAAREDLLDDRVVVVTPTERTREEDLGRLTRFWESLGARVQTMSAEAHDEALACTSHAPHVVASALAACTPAEYLPLAAGGWRDTTRIAAGDAELWRQILASNSGHVLKSLDEFAKKLTFFRRALADDDQDALRQLLEAGKSRRDALGS